jgi:uncharacterized protein YdeI (YjbR/CyaY-like superfamily)
MPETKLPTLDMRGSEEWHNWLAAHHASSSGVWLVFHKGPSPRSTLAYSDALDEALCFGWIDSLIKRVDDTRYVRKFTPRRADSVWSASNIKRYAQLKVQGRLQPPGLCRSPTDRRYAAPAPSSGALPAYIKQGLQGNARALRYFESLAPSHKRRYVGWIDSAKMAETKMRRLREAIGLLAAGKKLEMK